MNCFTIVWCVQTFTLCCSCWHMYGDWGRLFATLISCREWTSPEHHSWSAPSENNTVTHCERLFSCIDGLQSTVSCRSDAVHHVGNYPHVASHMRIDNCKVRQPGELHIMICLFKYKKVKSNEEYSNFPYHRMYLVLTQTRRRQSQQLRKTLAIYIGQFNDKLWSNS